MYFQHIFEKSLAHSSYFIGCQATKEAIVIDPKRDIDTYLQLAKENNLTITHIAETHIHADYLSGSLELAYVTGAKIYASDEGGTDWQYEYDHIGLKDGSEFYVGNLKFDVLHTPGHTPESISFLLTDVPATKEPVMLFTGDFIFVGDVGRPDLLETAAGFIGTKEIAAQQLFNSLEKFKQLPDYLQVWPAHGAGSACGKALGAVANTTVGYEKIRNWALKPTYQSKDFIQDLLTDQPEAPSYFSQMKKLNKTKRPLLIDVPKVSELSKIEFDKAKAFGMKVIDTRNKIEFANAHLSGTINIQNNNSFTTWMGWMINYEDPIILIAETSSIETITRKLMRIGMDNIYGYITPEIAFHDPSELQKVKLINADEVENYIHDKTVQILDVRSKSEYNSGHIPSAKHIFAGHLKQACKELDLSKKIILHCQAGDRATIATSFLLEKGFHVENYSAGIQDWQAKGKKLIK